MFYFGALLYEVFVAAPPPTHPDLPPLTRQTEVGGVVQMATHCTRYKRLNQN